MKTCGKCKQEKELDQFHLSKNRGYQAWCIECRKKTDKEYWEKRKQDKDKMEKKKEYNLSRRENMRKYLYEYFSSHPCVDCGEKDPIVLTFDHISGKKSFTISLEAQKGTIENIKKEIEKCEVRCANCHLRKTAKDFKWYKFNRSVA